MVKSGNTDAAEMLRAMRSFLKENDMMAYLAMMAVRLIELHRVLKPTGSLYLHCDPTASHYLKILLDAIFGKRGFRNEIISITVTPISRPLDKGPANGCHCNFPVISCHCNFQILTIEDLFGGKRPHLPWIDPSVLKKAKRENTEHQAELDV